MQQRPEYAYAPGMEYEYVTPEGVRFSGGEAEISQDNIIFSKSGNGGGIPESRGLQVANNGDIILKGKRFPNIESILTSNFEELPKASLDNLTAREWYIYHVRDIVQEVDASLPLEQKAYQAFEKRNAYRNQARELMLDQNTRRQLEIDHPNMTFEEKIAEKIQKKGMTRKEAIEDIFYTSIKTNIVVNTILGVK